MGKVSPPAEAPTGRPRIPLRAVRIVVACAELWIAYAWLFGLASPAQLIPLHLATVGAFFGVFWLTNRQAGLLVDGAMLFLTGPLAAVGMILRRQGRSTMRAVARATTEPVSPARSLYADIMAGRRPRREPSNQLSILDRLSSCDLASQQFAVAALSRAYRPEMHPALMAALQSPTPAVRVQAAAVFAKLRERHGTEAKRLLELSQSDGEVLLHRTQPLAKACRELARSPFLDDVVIRGLIEMAHRLEAELAPAVTAPAPATPIRAVVEPVMDDISAIGMAAADRVSVSVEAQVLATSRNARMFGSLPGGLERVT